MHNNINDPKRKAIQPHFRCQDQNCITGKYRTGVYLSDEQLAANQGAGGATPQGQPQAHAPQQGRQQVGFDVVLNGAGVVIDTIGRALKAAAVEQGVELNSGAWFAAVASVTCSFVIAASDGRLRLGPEPAPPPPQMSAKDRYLDAMQKAQDRKGVLKALTASAGDDSLDPQDKEAVEAFANGRLETLSLADQIQG